MARQKALQVFRGLKIPKADANDGLGTPGGMAGPEVVRFGTIAALRTII